MYTGHMGTCTRCGGSGKEPDRVAFGKKVRKARQAQGYGLRELAGIVGCSPAFLSALERTGGGMSGTKTRKILKELGL